MTGDVILVADGGKDSAEIQEYKIKEHNDPTKIFNNIYVKNFPPQWGENELRGLFGKYGDILSLYVAKKEKDGVERPFAFVCFGNKDNKDPS